MRKREEIIEMLKRIKPMITEGNGPTSFFIAEKDYRKLNISTLLADKDFIIVTTGKYLLKRKYRINKSEI